MSWAPGVRRTAPAGDRARKFGWPAARGAPDISGFPGTVSWTVARYVSPEPAATRLSLPPNANCSASRRRSARRHAPLRSAAAIGLAVGAVLNSRKVGKHFAVEIGDRHLSFQRRTEQIEQEARLDGIYVIRTSVPAEHLGASEAVQGYKDLSRVERAFRSLKTVDLDIRPIRHWTAPRVRAHVFLCMLAYHVEWHLRHVLAPLLFHDTELAAARAERPSPVASTEPSEVGKAKKTTRRSTDGQPVMGFADLMTHLGTLTRNTMRVMMRTNHRFTLFAKPTPVQEAAFRLLNIEPMRVQ